MRTDRAGEHAGKRRGDGGDHGVLFVGIRSVDLVDREPHVDGGDLDSSSRLGNEHRPPVAARENLDPPLVLMNEYVRFQ
jgi:hypothetical protein